MPICAYTNMPICRYRCTLLCVYTNMAIYQYGFMPVYRCRNMPVCRYRCTLCRSELRCNEISQGRPIGASPMVGAALCPNVTRLAGLADRMVGGPILRNVTRLAIWARAMVGGPLCRNVTPKAGLALSVVRARILGMGPSLQPLPSPSPIGLGPVGQLFIWTACLMLGPVCYGEGLPNGGPRPYL